MLIGEHGPVVVLDGKVCAAIEGVLQKRLDDARQRARIDGTDGPSAKMIEAVEEIRRVAQDYRWRAAYNGQIAGGNLPQAESGSEGSGTGTGRWLSTAEYASLEGISERAVTKRISTGKLPARRNGHGWLIPIPERTQPNV